LPSAPRPEDFAPGRRFGLVVASSFFSHLPERTFTRWLERLWGCVEPGGALALSTHGRELFPESPRSGEGGLVFVAASESARLDPEEYGTSYVTEAFVREAVRAIGGGEARVAFAPRGLAGHQDLTVVWRGGPEPPRVTRFPWGDVDRFSWEPALELSG